MTPDTTHGDLLDAQNALAKIRKTLDLDRSTPMTPAGYEEIAAAVEGLKALADLRYARLTEIAANLSSVGPEFKPLEAAHNEAVQRHHAKRLPRIESLFMDQRRFMIFRITKDHSYETTTTGGYLVTWLQPWVPRMGLEALLEWADKSLPGETFELVCAAERFRVVHLTQDQVHDGGWVQGPPIAIASPPVAIVGTAAFDLSLATPASTEPQKLGRFGHHPDPVVDFCTEVDAIDGMFADLVAGLETQQVVRNRVDRALEFKVGGDAHAVRAKRCLRHIDARLQARRNGYGG